MNTPTIFDLAKAQAIATKYELIFDPEERHDDDPSTMYEMSLGFSFRPFNQVRVDIAIIDGTEDGDRWHVDPMYDDGEISSSDAREFANGILLAADICDELNAQTLMIAA